MFSTNIFLTQHFFDRFFFRYRFPRKNIFQEIFFQGNFLIDQKIFSGKVRKNFGHQGRSKISLRIDCDHSQPLKTTLKHSYC